MELNRFYKLLESTMGNVKPLITEMDYETHKEHGLKIIERVIVTFNPGSSDVVEVEGILGEKEISHHHRGERGLMFKPLTNPIIYKSSDSTDLIKDDEINLRQSDPITQEAAEFLSKHKDVWLPIHTEYFSLVDEINFGEKIDLHGRGISFIGNFNCIIMDIQFDTI